MSEATVNFAEATSSSPRCAELPGWFGKIPNLGDFVSRRLPPEFVHDWDEWLQRGLLKMREDLGPDWLTSFLVAPVRRFWLAPGVLGSAGWAGVLMPSVDNVGRHFPLTIAAVLAIDEPERSLAAALHAGDWFNAIDNAARKVLDVHFTADDLEHELAQVAALPIEADITVPQLPAALLGAHSLPQSVWWCGEALVDAQFECFGALPPSASFAALLSSVEAT
jgi:type VI secretion system protein ImpM